MVRHSIPLFLACFIIFAFPLSACASENAAVVTTLLNLTHHWVGYLALAIFALAYVLAMLEEVTELRKSKPMVLAASLIWAAISIIYVANGMDELAGQSFRTALEGFAELFLFIMVSMAYLNAMEDRGIFGNLRIWLLSKGFSYRKLFWITGWMAFFLSSVCNNLTTALLMGAVVMAMGKGNKRFVGLACVNIVVATNAGGSFSPFGDITTLLVWQKGVVPFGSFYSLLVPAMVNFALPAALMHFWVPKEQPAAAIEEPLMKRGAFTMIVLFLLTIITAVCFENFLHLPPAAGMLMGLTYLKFFSYYMQKTGQPALPNADDIEMPPTLLNEAMPPVKQDFDVFEKVAHLEWDTLLFFYGVMMSVAGLSFLGYLGVASNFLYAEIDPTVANILVGIFSAFIDNGTIMYAVLTMHPDISQGQWLLVTLTSGVGGSLLAIGSAAGVGLMGQAKGLYTFSTHLKWMPVILIGYFGSIGVHFLMNQRFF